MTNDFFYFLPETKIDESLQFLFAHVLQNTLPGNQLTRLVSDQAVLGEDVVVLLQHRVATHLGNLKRDELKYSLNLVMQYKWMKLPFYSFLAEL